MLARLSDRNRKNLWIMLAADAATCLVALYRQFHTLSWPDGKAIPDRSAPFCWAVLAVMVLLTVIFVLLCREEEVIRGMPEEKKINSESEKQP